MTASVIAAGTRYLICCSCGHSAACATYAGSLIIRDMHQREGHTVTITEGN
jgi:hypothetical protein